MRRFAIRVAIRVARTTMLLCLLVAMAPAAHAQVDPRGALRTIAMPHFRVHFRPDQEIGRAHV